MNTNVPKDDPEADRFAREAGRLLRDDAEALDAATLSRLNRARQRALAEFDRHQRRPAWLGGRLQPALAVAAVALLAVALWVGREPVAVAPAGQTAADTGPLASLDAAADLDLVLADESLDLIGELEFYDWLDSDPGLSG